MRIVFVGTGKVAISTARKLLEAGHQVVFIETDKEKIDELSDDLDCGFMHGDGSSPHLLEEIGPKNTDVLFCLTGNDKDNMIAALVARSLGFPKVIVKVEDTALEHVCAELKLENIVVPNRAISRHLADMVEGRDVNDLSSAIKGEARFYSFIAGEAESGMVNELGLPDNARAICYYRDEEFHLADGETRLQPGDEVILLTFRKALEALKKKYPARPPEEAGAAEENSPGTAGETGDRRPGREKGEGVLK